MFLYRSRVPLRLGFGGGGSDLPIYSNKFGGQVLNVTIDRYVHVTLKPRKDDTITIKSDDFDITVAYDAKRNLPYDGNLDLVKAVINRLKNGNKTKISGFDLVIRADMPPGAGLGTSSAVVVAILGVMREWLGMELSNLDIANMAYMIERVDMGLAGGKQDQYSAALGGFNFIEFYETGKVVVIPLRIKSDIINELRENIILCYTGMIHKSEDLIKSQMPDTQSKEYIMHHIKNMAKEMRDCILCGNLCSMGELLSMEWDYKKKLSPDISNSTIQKFEDVAYANGAGGVKVTGAGGGGVLIIYCDWTKRKKLCGELTNAGGKIIDFSFVETGLESWGVR